MYIYMYITGIFIVIYTYMYIYVYAQADIKTHKGSLPKSLSHVQTVSTTLEDNQHIIKEHFDRFLLVDILKRQFCDIL